MKKLKLNIKAVMSALILSAFAGSAVAQTVLQEDFSLNKSNASGNKTVTLSSGVWDFYRVDAKYGSVTECAVLNYSSSNMGYIISPAVNQPGVITFDARLQNAPNASNSVIIQKSVNGGAFTTVGTVLVSGTTYQQYSIDIAEASNNVRIKFLRSAVSPSESSNYNIIIDNIGGGTITPPEPCAPNDNATLEVRDGTVSVASGSATCISNTLTLVNTGNTTLDISQIIVSGSGYSLSNAPTLPASLAPCQEITVSVNTGAQGSIGTLTIKSNDAKSPYVVSIYNK